MQHGGEGRAQVCEICLHCRHCQEAEGWMRLFITSVSLFVHLRTPQLGCIFPLELTQSRNSLTDTLQGLLYGACQVESLDYLSQWWSEDWSVPELIIGTNVTVTQSLWFPLNQWLPGSCLVKLKDDIQGNFEGLFRKESYYRSIPESVRERRQSSHTARGPLRMAWHTTELAV